jgi:hypothetical protein
MYRGEIVFTELNGQQVKIAKIQGEFVWQDHKEENGLFYVLNKNGR